MQDVINNHGDAMYALGQDAGRNEALYDAVHALLDAGHDAASKVVLDMMHARRLSAFVLRNDSIGAPRSPTPGVAQAVTTPAGATT